MTIELIAIGSELLSGFSFNSNAIFITQKLMEEGFLVGRQEVIPDDAQNIRNTFIAAMQRSPVVIVTGGLGPTLDDITKDVASEILKSPYRFSDEVAEDLMRRFGDIDSLKNQATVPEKAIIIMNKVGTAPGLIFKEDHSTLILLPGVPREMESMMLHDVIPYLKKHFTIAVRNEVKVLHFFGIYESMIDPILRELKQDYPNIELGIYPGLGKVSVVIKSAVLNDEGLDVAARRITEEFKEHLFDSQYDRIEEAICHRFREKKQFLSAAESCTGGRLSSKLVSVEGASDYFLGSIVCYSNFFKTKFLSVSEKVLESDGAVSEASVKEMAQHLLEETKADYSLAVSGIAGPTGGSATKPVGTVFGAIGYKENGENRTKVLQFALKGNREQILEATTNMMLFELYKVLIEGKC